MLHIIVNKSIVGMVIDCLMPRDRHEHICRSILNVWMEFSYLNLKLDSELIICWDTFLGISFGKGQIPCLDSGCQAPGVFGS